MTTIHLNIPAMATTILGWVRDTGNGKPSSAVRHFIEDTLGRSITDKEFSQMMQYMRRSDMMHPRANSQRPYWFKV